MPISLVNFRSGSARLERCWAEGTGIGGAVYSGGYVGCSRFFILRGNLQVRFALRAVLTYNYTISDSKQCLVNKERTMNQIIAITYCVPCGYERRAREAATALKDELGIDATLIPGKGGIFQVTLRETILTKRTRDHFPDTAEIVETVRAATVIEDV
jgi:selenoprotein W-related protein